MLEGINCRDVALHGGQMITISLTAATIFTFFFFVLASGPGANHGYFIPSNPIAAGVIYGPEALLFVYGVITIAIAGCIKAIQNLQNYQAAHKGPKVTPDPTIHEAL